MNCEGSHSYWNMNQLNQSTLQCERYIMIPYSHWNSRPTSLHPDALRNGLKTHLPPSLCGRERVDSESTGGMRRRGVWPTALRKRNGMLDPRNMAGLTRRIYICIYTVHKHIYILWWLYCIYRYTHVYMGVMINQQVPPGPKRPLQSVTPW